MKLFVPLALLLIGLPLVGLLLAGIPLEPYLEFPPRTIYVEHAAFSWWAFATTAMVIVLTVSPFVLTALRAGSDRGVVTSGNARLPWWGWLAAAWLAAAWVLAWNRFLWFGPLQSYTFSMLWIGYIVLINALAWRRTGRSLLTHEPAYFLALFPLSACFWWFFEFLNRFVQNWYYMGVGELDGWSYFLQATLPFATVLPAVLSTRELLASYPRLSAGLGDALRAPWMASRRTAWILLVFASLALVAVGVWPGLLFPALWLAPLAVLSALQVILGEPSILDGPANGDWRAVWQAALAGLVCGIFWETWNYHSLAHWEYSVPLVHRFQIFHMPLLGYAGYLPFGLECLAVAGLLHTLRRGDGSR